MCAKFDAFTRFVTIFPLTDRTKTEISTLSKKSQTFYTIIFFLIAPRDLHFLGPLGSIFSANEHVKHLF